MHGISYRPDIDGLRALAVTLVIIVHAFPNVLPNGYIGVDIFFVISGFLISGILIAQLERGSFSLRDFYVRRANRIFPALALVLIFSLGLGWFSLYANEYKLLGRSAAAGAGFAANINFWHESGYWDIASGLKPLLHLWSLGVEEQFYLLWPVLLWVAWTRRLNFAILAGVIICLSLIWNFYSTATDQMGAFYLPFSRFWELLVGGALAYIVVRRRGADPIASPVWTNLCALCGVSLVIAALVQSYPPEQFPGWRVIFPVLGTALIIAAGSKAWINTKLLANPWIVYVGLISYPLYVWHWPLLTFPRIIQNGQLSSSWRNAAVVLTILLAAATYHFVEKPIRFDSRYRGLKAIVLAAILAICGGAGLAIFAQDGVAARYDSFAQLRAERPPPSLGGTFKVAIVGDSQAGVLVPAIPVPISRLTWVTKAGWPYLIGTAYRSGISTPGPIELNRELDRVLADTTIEFVIITHMHVVYTGQDKLRSYPLLPNETSSDAYYAGLRRTVERLVAAGKKVIYVKSIPFLGSIPSVMACTAAALPIPRQRPSICQTSRAEIEESRQSYYQELDRIFGDLPDVFAFDPLPYLCDADNCYVERDGIVMYENESHLSRYGAYLIGIEILKLIERQNAALSPHTRHHHRLSSGSL